MTVRCAGLKYGEAVGTPKEECVGGNAGIGGMYDAEPYSLNSPPLSIPRPKFCCGGACGWYW